MTTKLLRLLPAALTAAAALCAAAAQGATGMDASHFASSSAMSSGRWVKIRVTQPGMQEIDYDTLREWGFTNPGAVRVYGFSTLPFSLQTFYNWLPDDLPQVPAMQYPSIYPTKLVFYSEGATNVSLQTNKTTYSMQKQLYTNDVYFFLSDKPVTLATPGNVEPLYGSAAKTNYSYHRALTVERRAEFNPAEAGSVWFSDKALPSAAEPLTLSYTGTLRRPLSSSASACSTNGYPLLATGVGVGANYTGSFTTAYTLKSDLLTINKSSTPSTTINSGPPPFNLMQNLESARAFLQFNCDPSAGLYPDFTVKLAPAQYPERYNWMGKYVTVLSYLRENVLDPDEAQMTMNLSFVRPNQDNVVFPLNCADPADPSLTITSTKPEYVWDVTIPEIPYNCKPMTDVTGHKYGIKVRPDYEGYQNTYPRIPNYRLIAFRPSLTLHKPTFVEEVKPQNLHAMAAPEYVIVTTESLLPQAERLAELHRTRQGLDVAVVTEDLIMNEFSSGTPHTMAYRLFNKMLYERGKKADGTSRYKYMLLLGPSKWDWHDSATPTGDFLLTFQTDIESECNNVQKNYVSVDLYGNVADNYVHSTIHLQPCQIAVGILDAYSPEEADTVIDKIEAYIDRATATDDAYNNIVLLADNDSSNEFVDHQEGAATMLMDSNDAVTLHKYYATMYSSDDGKVDPLVTGMAETLRSGTLLWSFLGHSDSRQFKSSYTLWDISLTHDTKLQRPPFGMFGTCEAFRFEDLKPSLVHEMIFAPEGGVMAAAAAGRQVISTDNQKFAYCFGNKLVNAIPGERLGDVYLNAKNLTISAYLDSPRVAKNARAYNLGGDPALPVPARSRRVTATLSATDPVAEDESTLVVYPMKPVTVTGEVVTADGLLDEAFNGTVYLTLLDGAMTLPSVTEQKTRDVILEQTILVKTTAEVTAGRFTATFSSPRGQNPGEINRLTFLARSNDGTTIGAGACNRLSISTEEDPAPITDTDAPVIEWAYVNSPDLQPSTPLTDDSATFMARITDAGSGLDTSFGTMANPVSLRLDNLVELPAPKSFIKTGHDGALTLTYPLSALSDGPHSLLLTVSDRAGNVASQTVEFSVAKPAKLGIALTADTDVARDEVTFDLSLDGIQSSATLVVRNSAGETVYTAQDPTFPHTWDLNGRTAPDGPYTATVTLRSGNACGAATTSQFVVLK